MPLLPHPGTLRQRPTSTRQMAANPLCSSFYLRKLSRGDLAAPLPRVPPLARATRRRQALSLLGFLACHFSVPLPGRCCLGRALRPGPSEAISIARKPWSQRVARS
mmetsp:Transcript_18853/g.52254  ORF Transcript_18853/g.52254 Transcript_18853/m.52254 type:complete len:106 (+) Transcript_18853:211-528(+)